MISMDNGDVFKDLIVVELASVLAGPSVGMFFAELGARVIKVENKKTGGDVTRTWKLPIEDPNDEYSAYYHSINWGKEKILLDLKDPSDRSEVIKLIEKADIIISNFKVGSAQKLKMDYDSLKNINPRIIYGSISAYGDDDPSPGFDVMMQAETGWIYMNGEPDGPPVKMPVALVDILTGHQLKQGLLIALMNREKTGNGSRVSISLYDAAIAALANQASNWLNTGQLPERRGSQHPNIAPYGDIFFTQDNIRVILGTGTQKQFEGLCEILNLDSLITDKRFLTNSLRLHNRNDLNEYLKPAFTEIPFDKLFKLCQAKKVTIAPINNLRQVFENGKAQKLILKETLPDGRVKKSVRTVVFKIES